MKKVVNKLRILGKTVSTMESCTGGGVANAITNIEGASEVLKFSAVTYSNEFKIKMGVDKSIIDTYTVYSMETADAMSKTISDFTGSDYGVGVTGKLYRVDKDNPYGANNVVFISIYSKSKDKYYNYIQDVEKKKRKDNKQLVIDLIAKKLLEILKEE